MLPERAMTTDAYTCQCLCWEGKEAARPKQASYTLRPLCVLMLSSTRQNTPVRKMCIVDDMRHGTSGGSTL